MFGIRPVVSFIDDHEGWLLAPGSPTTQCDEANATVWHTADAGNTWQQLGATGMAPAQCKNGIWFADAKHGFITAWDDNHPARIYRTSDGGATWSPTALLPNPPNYQSAGGGVGWQVTWIKSFGTDAYLGANGTPYIFESTDGGAGWQWVTKTPTPSVVLVTESRWLDFSDPSQPMESLNGGQQFHAFTTDFRSDGEGTAFVFAGASVGYASAGGLLQRTVDGGTRWTRILARGSRPTPNPTVLSAPSTDVVWALDGTRHLYRSTDGAKTWEQKAMPAYTGPSGVEPLMAFADDRHGWVMVRYAAFMSASSPPSDGVCLSQEIQLWRTDDAATTWTLVSFAEMPGDTPGSVGASDCKDSMYFADAQHGFIAVSGSIEQIVYRSSDGGVTWTRSQFPVPPAGPTNGRVVAIKALANEVRAFAPPYVYGSVDAGATWHWLCETPFAVSNLAFVTASRWVALNPFGPSTETTDSGATWHPFATHYTQASLFAPQAVFADASVGYASAGNRIQRTEDGGAHWSSTGTPGT